MQCGIKNKPKPSDQSQIICVNEAEFFCEDNCRKILSIYPIFLNIWTWWIKQFIKILINVTSSIIFRVAHSTVFGCWPSSTDPVVSSLVLVIDPVEFVVRAVLNTVLGDPLVSITAALSEDPRHHHHLLQVDLQPLTVVLELREPGTPRGEASGGVCWLHVRGEKNIAKKNK